MPIETRVSNQKSAASVVSEVIKTITKKDANTTPTKTPPKLTFPYENEVNLGSGVSFIIDWALGGVFVIQPTGNFTLAFLNLPPSPLAGKIVIIVLGASGFTATLPSDGQWSDGTEPTWSSNVVYGDAISVLARPDGKTYWMQSFLG